MICNTGICVYTTVHNAPFALVVSLIPLCFSLSEGAVLIFLPGYDEIVALRDCILHDDRRFADNPER